MRVALFRVSILTLILLGAQGCQPSPAVRDAAASPQPPTPVSPPASIAADIGELDVEVLEVYFWRDWMPMIANPGSDRGSPLYGTLRLRLHNPGDTESNLRWDFSLMDESEEFYPATFSVEPGGDGTAWTGGLAAGEQKTVTFVTRDGPYLPVGSKVCAVMTFSGEGGVLRKVQTPWTPIARTD